MSQADLLRRLNGHFFEGDVKEGNMAGVGKYTFANGTVYHGNFTEGMFDGEGTLFFPKGGKFVATWRLGKLVKGGYVYDDDLEFKREGWKYGTDADRRFWTEIRNGIKLSDVPQLVDREPPAEVPYGCFDVGDGYFSPQDGTVFNYDHSFNRIATVEEAVWATTKCRVGVTKGVTATAKAAQPADVKVASAAVLKPAAVVPSASSAVPAVLVGAQSKAQPAAAAAAAPAAAASAAAAAPARVGSAGAKPAKPDSAAAAAAVAAPAKAAAAPLVPPVDVDRADEEAETREKFCPATIGQRHNFSGPEAHSECSFCGLTRDQLKTVRESARKQSAGSRSGKAAAAGGAPDVSKLELGGAAGAPDEEWDGLIGQEKMCPASIGQPHSFTGPGGQCTACGLTRDQLLSVRSARESTDGGDGQDGQDGQDLGADGQDGADAGADVEEPEDGFEGDEVPEDGPSALDTCPATTGGVHVFVDGVCSECGQEQLD